MRIGELIELLTDAAQELPLGQDAEVRVHLCAGHDRFAILTKAVSVGQTDASALISGHPHLDDGPTVRRPLTIDADAELAMLVDDLNSVVPAAPETVLVEVGNGKAYRLPMRSTGKVLAPGELDALRVGCLCDPGRNEEARRASPDDGHIALVIHQDCPVHQTIDVP